MSFSILYRVTRGNESVTAELVKRKAGQNELYKGAMNLGQIMTNSAGGIQLDPAGPYNPPTTTC